MALTNRASPARTEWILSYPRSCDFSIERLFRDRRSMMITEGAVEVLRMALARMILNVR